MDGDDFFEEEEEALLLALAAKNAPHTREWVHEINELREELGEYHRLIQELRADADRFHTYFRMSTDQFDELVTLLTPVIQKKNTNYRRAICVGERLAITLRYLATGDAFTTVAFNFRVGITTVASIVVETSKALWDVLVEEYMPIPTVQGWREIADRYRRLWHFPNCIGAIDGKHVQIQAPPNSGTLFFNYKGSFSIVLLAVVDADYKFTYLDIGGYGSNSDGGLFRASGLGRRLLENSLDIPDDAALPNTGIIMPHVIVGDPAFPLKPFLMKPYSGKNLSDSKLVFNYRLSRARRCSENAFGILAQRWRIYNRRIQLHADNATAVVKATCILHNYLQRNRTFGDPADRDEEGLAPLVNEAPAGALGHLQARHVGGNRVKAKSEECRDKFKDYFVSAEGEVYWQWDKVRREAPDAQQ